MTPVEKELKSLKKDMANLRHAIGKQIEESASNGLSKLDFLHADDLRNMAEMAGKNVKHFLCDKKDQIEQTWDSCESAMKKHPLKSAAAAFAGGMLVAMLCRRR